MPPWWGKSSPKDVKKKESKESKTDTRHQKSKISSDEKSSKSEGSHGRDRDNVLDRGSASRAQSKSVSRCLSFEHMPFSRPLPLPGEHVRCGGCADSKGNASEMSGTGRGSKPLLFLPLPKPKCKPNRSYHTDAGDIATGSASSRSSIDSDRSESCLLSPQISDCEYGKITTINSPTSVMCKVQSASFAQKYMKETLNPENIFIDNQILAASPKHGRHTHMSNLQIPRHNAFCSAADTLISSPSRSPMRRVGTELVMNSGSGHCSSPGSGCNSGPCSIAGDVSGQRVWQHSRCSSECSPVASPRMTSPGPGSRIQSGAATPLHHRAGEAAMESPTKWLSDGKQKSHPLPLPPVICPFSPVYSTATTSSVPRSPGRTENPISPCSRWKKGRLLGMGTFGHVYLGFNRFCLACRESGEMCAMKEVTLLPDDVKSKESSQQLGQEIALLSRLRHPNIVQYYGSETVGDKLYIYLEFVSGGSIFKLLQDYGQLGEMALRSYTRQILSGLAYLHDKNTVHRDIKGANLLVDPSGRVKLADFGMAKHITGHSCPLSFKGSPYWMAPELINNSSGCNLAVDIWSLGCTVLEMATGRPPWNQYEGVAALFKIGNSKELPDIPDHLSEEGKDFVKKCLRRNPVLRPTAAQLFEHPFIKYTAPLERPIMFDPLKPPALGIGGGRVAIYKSRCSKMVPESSEIHTPRNVSGQVSPISSPILQSKSPQHISRRLCPPLSSPHTQSGSSRAFSSHRQKQSTAFSHDSIGIVPRSLNHLYIGPNTRH